MPSLPTGTVTFLFTDIEGSTALLQSLGDRRYAEVLEDHRRLLRAAFDEGHGQVVDTQGDAFLVAFSRARDALATAVAAQRALTKHAWPDGAALRVRIGLHIGEPVSKTGDYIGLDVHRAARICSAGHGGQILLSHAVEAVASADLPAGLSLRDLGKHRLKDLRDPEHLFQVVHPDLATDFPPLKSLDARPNNLPRQLTSFIGREKEMVEVKRLLSTAYLLTLTGSGGAGKTRLALQVAADVLDEYPDGVWLVELASIADPILVPKTVASAMNVPEQPGREMTETLVDALRPKALLLVLDNCEHLLAACRNLTATLLRRCPQVRILATSREALGVPGETLWKVPSLSLPEDVGHLPPPEKLVLYDAVRLFADRAVTMSPGFTVTSKNASAVIQVCQQLDGIPLAIELAAVRVKVLTVEQIAARLNDRFRLLTGGSQVLLPHHQTLRATLDWSYDLLSERERILLRRLSVFAGGFTLETAEQICAGEGIEEVEVLELLAHLADKSLVIVDDQDGAVRYRLLETVRQYARDRLLEEREAPAVRTRHRNFFLALAEATEPRLFGPDEVALLERLETEHDNLRGALAWSLETGDADAGLRFAGALGWFWYRNGHWTEGREWAARALQAGAAAEPAPKARALSAAGLLAWAQGDMGPSRSLGEEELALCERLNDKRGVADALYRLGLTTHITGDHAQATTQLQEALRLFREVGDRYGMASTLRFLGSLATNRGAHAEAVRFAEESMALYRAVGYRRGVAHALQNLGRVALLRLDYSRASTLFEESLEICQEAKDGEGIAIAQALLGRVAYVMGDYRQAVTLLQESVRANQEMGNRRFLIFSLELLATVRASTGKGWRAARLFGAAETLRETGSIGIVRGFFDQAEGIAAARSALGEAKFAAAWAEGRAMTLEQAIADALSAADEG